MARTIKEIQGSIAARVAEKIPGLSTSAVAEWRLWSYVVAVAVNAFEVIMDAFRREIDAAADKITPGTVRWYAEQAYRFQNGHSLVYNPDTAQLYYQTDEPAARIVSVVAVSEGDNALYIKVAKTSEAGEIVPLSTDELYNFSAYVDAIKFAGIQTTAISTDPDTVRYNLTVYFNPAISMTTVRENVIAALDAFRTSIGFDSRLYTQKLINAVLAVDGVITVDLKSLARKATGMPDFVEVGVADELRAGYFDYSPDSTLELINSSNIPL